MEERKKYYLPEDFTSSDFPQIDLHYRESRDDAWSKIQSQINTPKSASPKILTRSFYAGLVAASLIFFLGMTTFFRFYTKTAYCPTGQHLVVNLPDQSEVILNAESIIAWHPFWMKFERNVKFEGEAYFRVKKGSGFKVISSMGETKVLGTTFNIYSREEDYRVSCLSGSVQVGSSDNQHALILHPGDEGTVQKDGQIKLLQLLHPETSTSWVENMFVFTGASLNTVIREVERQYNIHIKIKENYPLTYTGNFNKSITAEEVLKLICTSLELKFEAKSDDEYLIFKD